MRTRGIWPGDGGFAVRTFVLICVIAAGLFGALTVSRKIMFVRALPGAVALVVDILLR